MVTTVAVIAVTNVAVIMVTTVAVIVVTTMAVTVLVIEVTNMVFPLVPTVLVIVVTTVQCAVGWNDFQLHFLRFSKSHTFLLIRYIFRRSIPKNQQISPHARASHAQQSFHFQKIAVALKEQSSIIKF